MTEPGDDTVTSSSAAAAAAVMEASTAGLELQRHLVTLGQYFLCIIIRNDLIHLGLMQSEVKRNKLRTEDDGGI